MPTSIIESVCTPLPQLSLCQRYSVPLFPDWILIRKKMQNKNHKCSETQQIINLKKGRKKNTKLKLKLKLKKTYL